MSEVDGVAGEVALWPLPVGVVDDHRLERRPLAPIRQSQAVCFQGDWDRGTGLGLDKPRKKPAPESDPIQQMAEEDERDDPRGINEMLQPHCLPDQGQGIPRQRPPRPPWQPGKRREIKAEDGRHKVKRRPEGGMQAELLRPAPAIGHQHFGESGQRSPRTAADQKLGIVQEFFSARLDGVHQGVFFVGI